MKSIKIAILIGLLALVIRLPGLGQFMTVDEENWMIRSAGFYHKLFRLGDPGGTFLTTHPGATPMWLIGAGVFMQEARVGFDIDTSNLQYFRLAATLPIALTSSFLIGAVSLLCMRLFGIWPGIIGGGLLALEPYLVGMSQVAHLDMLMGLFMLNAVLAFFCQSNTPGVLLWDSKRTPTPGVVPVRWLLVTGVFSGLALATKLLPALWLFVFFGLVLVWQYRFQISEIVRRLGFISGVAMLTFFVAWPALWVKDDISRSVERDTVSVVTQEHVVFEESEDPIAPASFYIRTILGRATPFTLILVVGAVVSGVVYQVASRKYQVLRPELWLILYAVGYLLLITLAAKKADRYAIPALVTLPIIAGIGLGRLLETRLPRPAPVFVKTGAGLAMTVLMGVLLIGQVAVLIPHAIAYGNPFWDVRPLPQQGWGEGLEEAAAWLNQQPLGEQITVASWYPGVLGTYFRGKTTSLSAREDNRVAYVVLYRNMWGRGPDDIGTNIIQEFTGLTPIQTISIQGKPYAWIYETLGLPYFSNHVGELTTGIEVGQTVPVSQENWNRIDVGLSNFSGRENTEDVILHIREDVNATADIRNVRKNARDVVDSDWNTFTFEPIPDSAGKTFYVSLTSPTSSAGNAITVRFSEADIRPGQMVLMRRALTAGEQVADFFRAGDIAYRLPQLQGQQ